MPELSGLARVSSSSRCRCVPKTCLRCERSGSRGYDVLGFAQGAHMHQCADRAACDARIAVHDGHGRHHASCPMCRTEEWITARNIRLAKHRAGHDKPTTDCEFCRTDARVREIKTRRGIPA